MSNEYQPTSQDPTPKNSTEIVDSRGVLPQLGQKLLNRYEIFGVKEGGLGVIFFVTDLKTQRDYAVKTYKSNDAHLRPNIEQFHAEVNFWIKLEPHPNIVTAHFVEVIQEQAYLFMDYITGGENTSLRDWLREGNLNKDQAVNFAYQLCLAMEFANRKDEIVHGDLKPENILIDENGILKVTDFGLAHAVQISQGQYPKLNMGSWPYAAPERFKKEVEDSRSDIYSFGIILYELLTGKFPYPFQLSQSPSDLFKQLSDFHAGRGGHSLSEQMYYGDDPSGGIIAKCIDDQGERYINFAGLRRSLEFRFKLTPPKDDPKPKQDNLHQRALTLHKIGYFAEALLLYNRLLQQHPRDAALWFDAAQTLLADGQRDTAAHFLKQAFHLDPTLERK
jgi:serine/threonine protein kinase